MPSSSPPSLAEALEAHRAGRTREADAIYRRVLAADPRCADAWHMHGVLALQMGDRTAAIERIRTALEIAPTDAIAWTNLGNALIRDGEESLAAEAFTRATELAPTLAEAWLGLGEALRKLDRLGEAIAAYERAVEHRPGSADAHHGLGIALKQDGWLEPAAHAYRRALELEPDDAAILVNLGHALSDAGDYEPACEAYERALALDSDLADAHYGLFALRYDDQCPARAEAHLRRALSIRPAHHPARYALAVLCSLHDAPTQAAQLLAELPDELDFLRASHRYVDAHRTPNTRTFTDTLRLLTYAIGQAQVAGLVLELGVRRGLSINHLASKHRGEIFGFDAFEGLPTAWGDRETGAYTTHGELPEVRDNVTLVKGWFRETLPDFAEGHAGPIRFLNVDCDLHASTAEALDVLGPRLVPGSIVVFDELLENPGWPDEEHRALVEAATRFGFSYEHIAFGISTKQVAIRVVPS